MPTTSGSMPSRYRLANIVFFQDKTSTAVRKIDDDINNIYNLINSVVKGNEMNVSEEGDLKYDISTNTWFRYNGSDWEYATPRRVELSGAITGGGNLDVSTGIIQIPVNVVWSQFDARYKNIERYTINVTANTEAVFLVADKNTPSAAKCKIWFNGDYIDLYLSNTGVPHYVVNKFYNKILNIRVYHDTDVVKFVVLTSEDGTVNVELDKVFGTYTHGDGSVPTGTQTQSLRLGDAGIYPWRLLSQTTDDCYLDIGKSQFHSNVAGRKTYFAFIDNDGNGISNFEMPVNATQFYTDEQPVSVDYLTTTVNYSSYESVAEGFEINAGERLFIHRRKLKVYGNRRLVLTGVDVDAPNMELKVEVDGNVVASFTDGTHGIQNIELSNPSTDTIVNVKLYLEAVDTTIIDDISVHVTYSQVRD